MLPHRVRYFFLCLSVVVLGLNLGGADRLSAASTTVSVSAVSGASTGLTINSGDGATITASGNWCSGGIKHDGSASCGGPGGIRPSDPGEHPLALEGAPIGALLGRVGTWTFLIGNGGSFTAQASGQLTLLMNDYQGHYNDNSGSVTATVSINAASAPPVSNGGGQQGSSTGPVTISISVDRGEGATYYNGDSITTCIVVTPSADVHLTDTVNGSSNPTQDLGVVNGRQCFNGTVGPPLGQETLTADALVNGRVAASAAAHYQSANRTSSGGNSPAQPPPVSVPATPSNVQLVAQGPSTLYITWTPNSFNESGFDITRDQHFAPEGHVPGGTYSYVWNGLPAGSYICISVRAVNAAGPSAYSSWSCTTLPAASGNSGSTGPYGCNLAPTLCLTVNPTLGPPGTNVQVSGTGLPTNAQLELMLLLSGSGNPTIDLGSVTTTSSSNLNATFTVPQNTTPGNYLVRVVQSPASTDASRQILLGDAGFTVTAGNNQGSTNNPPFDCIGGPNSSCNVQPPSSTCHGTDLILLAGINSSYNDGTFDELTSYIAQSITYNNVLYFSYNRNNVRSYGPYDTWESMNQSVAALNSLIASELQQCPDTTFDLIGHSLGGAVALNYLELYGLNGSQSGRVKHLITLDSPVNGVDYNTVSFSSSILDNLFSYLYPVNIQTFSDTDIVRDLNAEAASSNTESLNRAFAQRVSGKTLVVTVGSHDDKFVPYKNATIAGFESEWWLGASGCGLLDWMPCLGHGQVLHDANVARYVVYYLSE